MVERVVLLEFRHEAEAYAQQCRRLGTDPSTATVVSMYPRVASWLHQQGIRSVNTLPYINSESHARALYKSDQVLNWLDAQFHIEDALGISEAYSNALIWYSRYCVHHMLWLSELLSAVLVRHPGAALQASLEHPQGHGGPMVQESEKYLGWLAEGLCRQQELEFLPIDTPPAPGLATASPKGGRLLRRLAFRLGAHLHRTALRKMSRDRPLLVLSSGYRMDALVRLAREEAPELLWTIRGEVADGTGPARMLRRAVRGMAGLLNHQNGGAYLGEVWPQVLERAMGEDRTFTAELTSKLESLAQQIEAEPQLFSHNGVPFGPQFAAKVRNGIAPAIRRQHLEVKAADELLELLRPRLVMTPFGRRTLHAMGALGRRRGIPGLLISHGSFGPIKNDLEEKGWSFHSAGMLYGSYTHAALQTPLAEGFAKKIKSPSEFVVTGPLAWGWKVDRGTSRKLRSTMLDGNSGCRVIMHAGTPKFRSGIHFHVYETPDEYVQGIIELIQAVEQVPNAFLIVKFRPSWMTVEDFRSLLPSSDRYMISADEPFLDVLGFTDLLVSFSSTTIEEALQNQVPVLLYGGQGRYQHIEAFDVIPGEEVKSTAVYSVRHAAGLADGLKRILKVNGPAPLPEELFERYVYKPEDITPFPQLLRRLVGEQPQTQNGSRKAQLGGETGGSSI